MTLSLSGKNIVPKIYWIRAHGVMLDRDLAVLYGVKAIAPRQQVKRNLDRFPSDFMFQLTQEEVSVQVSQSVIPHPGYLGGSLPYAFTQEGVSMLSGVLRSAIAIRVNIAIMRAFVRIRQVLSNHHELQKRLDQLEKPF